MKQYFVYMLASDRNGTIYIGVTGNLLRRVYEHREELTKGFTSRYGVKRLVWFEPHESITTSIQREKTLKHWSRTWKISMIEQDNPTWRDLYEDLTS